MATKTFEGPGGQSVVVPDPQVPQRARRRSYSAKYKAAILAEYDKLDKRGKGELICAVIVPGRIRMTDLGRRLHLERSGLSNLVDRLEQRGLVSRVRDSQDRRVTWVELTAEGTDAAMSTYGEVTAQLRRLLSLLTHREQKQLTNVVERLLNQGAR
jgi:DNA-binding MarR family transcriptional regulator